MRARARLPREPGGAPERLYRMDMEASQSFRRLESDLTASVAGEVRFDEGSRALYATDASNYRHVALRDRHQDELRRRYPQIPRRVSGYENLDQLFDENGFNVAKALVGTEGTCVTILEAELDLVASPREHAIAILGFADVFAAADAVPEVLTHGPMGLEGMDHLLADYIRKLHLHEAALDLLPEGKGWLIAQFGGDSREEAAGKARRLVEAMHREGVTGKELDSAGQRQKIWAVREAALAATAAGPAPPHMPRGSSMR